MPSLLLPEIPHKKKALLIGIQGNDEAEMLECPHRDVKELKKVLVGKHPAVAAICCQTHTAIELYGYNPKDIVAMCDGTPDNADLEPTRDNIVGTHASFCK
jgi:hypothetical protein